jgi:hypothetical protein
MPILVDPTKIVNHLLWGDLNQDDMSVHQIAAVPSVSRDMRVRTLRSPLLHETKSRNLLNYLCCISIVITSICIFLIALFSSFPFYFILYSPSTKINPVHGILYFSVILCVNNLLLVPSPQFVYKLYILFYSLFRLFMVIIR